MNEFAGDHGDADPTVLALLTAYAKDPNEALEVELMRVLPSSRWLIPVVPAPEGAFVEDDHDHLHDHPHDHEDEPDDGRGHEHGHEHGHGHGPAMVTTVLTSATGTRALPVFGSLAALTQWDPAARPVPVRMPVAALAAAQESCEVLLLDLGSEHEVVLRSTMVWALAEERAWLPAHADPVVRAAVDAVVRSDERMEWATLEAGMPAGSGALRVVVGMRPGLDEAAVAAVVSRVGSALAGSAQTRTRVDAVSVVIRVSEGESVTSSP